MVYFVRLHVTTGGGNAWNGPLVQVEAAINATEAIAKAVAWAENEGFNNISAGEVLEFVPDGLTS
jgi:hypothetical protein